MRGDIKRSVAVALIATGLSLTAPMTAQASPTTDAANAANVARNSKGQPSLPTVSTLNSIASSKAKALTTGGNLSLSPLPASITSKYENTSQFAGYSSTGAVEDAVSLMGSGVAKAGVDSLGVGTAKSSDGTVYVVLIEAKKRVSAQAAPPPATSTTKPSDSSATSSRSTSTTKASAPTTSAADRKKAEAARKAAAKAKAEAEEAKKAQAKAEAARKAAEDKAKKEKEAAVKKASEEAKKQAAALAQQEADAKAREEAQAKKAAEDAKRSEAEHQASLDAARGREQALQHHTIQAVRWAGVALLVLAVIAFTVAGVARLRVRRLAVLPPANLDDFEGADPNAAIGSFGNRKPGKSAEDLIRDAIADLNTQQGHLEEVEARWAQVESKG